MVMLWWRITGILILTVCITRGATNEENSDQLKGTAYSGCCSFPCQNNGVCLEKLNGGFSCDCGDTGYYGSRCQRPYWKTWFFNYIRPSPEGVHKLVSSMPWIWNVINRFYFLRSMIMKVVLQIRTDILDMPPVYTGMNSYPVLDNIYNFSIYARVLPPIPSNCPTPMGIKGPTKLPDIDVVVEKVFRRRQFKPCVMKTNVLFASYAQHFTHMFFKTDVAKGPSFTWGHQNVDMTNIYGNDKRTENELRTFQNGLLKSQIIQDEEFPVFIDKANVNMVNPKNKSNVFALGHSFFSVLPTLSMFSIMFLREHNRVAKILTTAHPSWDDERIFQTTKLIILGETLKITVEDYVQHLSNYPFQLTFDPEILFHQNLQYYNRVHFEFNLLYHWHPLMPDSIVIQNKTYEIHDWMYDPGKILEIGLKPFIEGLVNTRAGMVTSQNHGKDTLYVAKMLLQHSRNLRLMPLNEYRKRYRLKPFTSFLEMTGGDEEMAGILKELYQDVEAIELYPGLLAEKRRSKALFGSTIVEMGSPSSLQGIFGNMFASPKLWRPSTFGGDIGFDIVKKATLENFFCNNMPNGCPRISFKTHGGNKDVVVEKKVKKSQTEL